MGNEKIQPKGYLPRIVDKKLEKLLSMFGAVEIAGTMWCGKTWTGLHFSESITQIGLAGPRAAAEADPSTALIGEKPHLIDEWQDVPAIWDEVRMAVDAKCESTGSFILTGSAEAKKDQLHHSGAGRIAKVQMGTMTLQEIGESTGKVSLAGLFEGKFEPCHVGQQLELLAHCVCRGGWPALAGIDVAGSEYIDSYFDALFDVSIPRKGFSGSQSRRVAQSLARNLGAASKLSTIAEDAQIVTSSPKAAAEKAAQHIAALESLYVLESIQGWDAPIRSKSRLRTKPKHYFADPSLAASLLQVTPSRLLENGQLFGILFEALAIHDLKIYGSSLQGAQATPLFYYRDSDGLEVDAIIELRDGRWAGFEVKLGENKVEEAAKSLNRLRRKIASNPAARNPEPAFMAVIVGAGEFARHLKDEDVYVIPLTVLGM